jgi:PHP family Zn ribbon phosphoesterase
MKTSEAENNNWMCPECGGKTSQDVKGKGFVRHLERFTPKQGATRRNSKNQCRYGRGERDQGYPS